MHPFAHQAPPQPLTAPPPGFPPLHSNNESPPTPEPAISGRTSSVSDASSGISTKLAGEETPLTSNESIPSTAHMSQPRKSQTRGLDQQHAVIMPPQGGNAAPSGAPDAHQDFAQAQNGDLASPRMSTAPAQQPANYYEAAPAAHFSTIGVQRAPEQHPNFSHGQLAPTTLASSYAGRPPFQEQVACNELRPQPVPGHQAYPYQQGRPREEALSIPAEQQYEEYMHNPGTLGLAAALYHDTQSSATQPQQSAEVISSQPVRSSETPPQPPEALQATTYSAYNPYEQHGLVPTQGYYPSDVQYFQLQGTALPPLSTGMSTVPGFALVHPGSMGQPVLAPPPQTHAQAQLYAQGQGQGYDNMQPKTLSDHRKNVKGRSRSTMRFHECSVCGKRFGRPSALQTHVYSHTGEKPYKCDLDDCARCFSVLSNLRRHQRVHHGPGVPSSPAAQAQYPTASKQGQDENDY